MKTALLVLCTLIINTATAQHLTYREWQELSFRDMRLMPEYGHRPKNAEMMASDSSFVAQTLAAIPDPQKASEHLVDLGFGLLREGDLTRAMYRFNQGYLVDPKNPSIFRGYGAFFLALDRNAEAAQEYQKGLALDSLNGALMTDMAGVFLAEYHTIRTDDPEKAEQLLNGASGLAKRALDLDATNAEAAFKLSVCHFRHANCKEAWTYFQQSVTLGSPSADEAYRKELQGACPQ
ncbi:MAG: hypothetical protein IPH05_13945 [Flavobacteriales bacterium]|jgi:Flp pilus assembly protein TadD|nr:hypothetical protein [Flavobacteriales bacterium]MBK6549399.1 hypothetical protein [Flavobacteriales bacterium]MBK6884013.1 hypothetical protein [Flavobacteriales bacterium]MBK7100403.1 hypothetical protein [Flavobacteriales bacterium]MBK7111098.1 hypothetical protein [Flavobacteriales bacterium]